MNINKLVQQAKKLQTEMTQIEADSSNPAILKDNQKMKELSQDLSNKRKELSAISEVISLNKQIEETEKLLKETTDKEMSSLAQDELNQLNKQKQKREKELLNEDTSIQEIKNCILEIRAGTGGEEANLFALDLFRMYTKYAESNNWKVQILSKNQTGKGGFKEVIVQITGKGSYNKLQYESGVHRVQRIPVTESSGRIHTSAASVVVYPLLDEKEINIDQSEIKIDVYRSSGPGGQSVNTTDSAVRITHIPTGTIVTCQDEKSQHKNKKKALSILASRLKDVNKEKQQEELSDIRKSAIKTGDRSAKIRTYNYPQNRVTDHRIKKSWHNLKAIVDGDLATMIEDITSFSNN
ncbi:peptide chain release factor 1 [Patescibacteria group bacterium]